MLFDFFPSRTLTWYLGKTFAIRILAVLIMLVLVLMPLLGRWKLGHGFNIGFTFALLLGAIGLTVLAVREDRVKPEHAQAVREARQAGERAVELARKHGIPPAGAIALLRDDPQTQGPSLFVQHCASCHSHAGGADLDLRAKEPSAPNLFGFATQAWIKGLLDPAKGDGESH